MSGQFGYSDFISLFRVDDQHNWTLNLVVRGDGVYVLPLDDAPLAHSSERAALTAHRTGNLTEPTLTFPFSISELEAFCDMYDLHCAMSPFDLAKLAVKEAPRAARGTNDSDLSSRERDSHLRIIYGVACAKPYEYDPSVARGVAAPTIASATAAAGCPVDDDTVRKYLKEAAEKFGRARAGMR